MFDNGIYWNELEFWSQKDIVSIQQTRICHLVVLSLDQVNVYMRLLASKNHVHSSLVFFLGEKNL